MGAFDVKDSDNYIKINNADLEAYIAGLDIYKFKNEIFRLKSKSFLIIDENNIVVDIIEKSIKSEYIGVGLYGFDEVQKFNKAYLYLKENDVYSDEIYLSHIISYLIGTKKSLYHYIEADDYEDWGTLTDWQLVQKRHNTYFVDVDGVLFYNRGKYGSKNWSNDNQVIEENLKIIKELSYTGAQIIIITSRSEEFRKELINILESNNLKYHALINGVNHSTRIIINDFAETNPFPSCKAINIPRNGKLTEYL